MVTDIDIYRSANLLIKQYGDKASEHALTQIMSLEHKGDKDGVAVWRRMHKAIDYIYCTELEDEKVH